MSRLNELIKELCPDGVEYRELHEVLTIKNGSDYKQFGTGNIPVYGSGGIMTYIDRYAYNKPSVLIPRKGSIDKLYYVEEPFWNVDTIFYTDIDVSQVIPRFVYFCLQMEHLEQYNTAGGVPSLTQKVLNKIKLPVPPLEVQREIVRVLDSFTLLTAELTAELTARKKQYEFYRNKLLMRNNDTKMVELGEICDFVRGPFGGALKKEIFQTNGYAVYEQQNAIYRNLKFRYFIDRNKFHELKRFEVAPGDLIVSCSGTIGKTFVIPINAPVGVINQALLKLTPKADLDVFYLQYFFENTITKMLNSTARGGAIKNVPSVNELKTIKLPLPSLDVQHRLVETLDSFDSICTDLNIGLPAEIEARQKQYEYYRDSLLTFAETGSIIPADQTRPDQTRPDQTRPDQTSLIKLIQYVFGYVTLPMGSLFDFRNGLSKGKEFFGTGIPFIRYTDVYNKRFLRKNDITALVECTLAEVEKLGVHRGDVFFTRTSETAEDVGWSSVMLDDIGDCVFNGFTIKAMPKTEYLLPEYCAFCFATDNFRQYVTSHCAFTTRASLTGKTISEYSLSFPSIERQREIVDVLSKFHTLCNDLSTGLPAEIEARQKQYEYYRDKLLSFKEVSESIGK